MEASHYPGTGLGGIFTFFPLYEQLAFKIHLKVDVSMKRAQARRLGQVRAHIVTKPVDGGTAYLSGFSSGVNSASLSTVGLSAGSGGLH